MNNILLFLILIFNFLFHKIKFSFVKLFVVSIILLTLVLYYVNCQKIYTCENIITVSKVAGIDSLESVSVYMFINNSLYKSSYEEDNENYNYYGRKSKFGRNIISFVINAKADSLANIFDERKWHSLSDSIKKLYCYEKHEFTKYIKNAENNAKYISLLNNIDAVYQVGVASTKPRYIDDVRQFKSVYSDNYVYCTDTFIENKNNFECWYSFAYDDKLKMKGDDGQICDAIDLVDYRLFSYFSPIDISKMYFVVNLMDYIGGDNCKIKELIIEFGSHTEFSEMYPKPDYMDMSCIKFTSSEKLDYMRSTGQFKFLAKITDNESVQSTKLFIITTFMSGIFAYWITLMFRLIKNLIHKSSNASNQRERSCNSVVLLKKQ